MEKKFDSDVVIGLEIHIELNTASKLFCGCATKGSEEPNSRVCPICLGHPGSKPVLNKKALEYALKLGIALNCEIDSELVFSRKSYFYPDMSKNYQITQYERPLCTNGFLKLKSGKKVKIKRIHIEEDPAALVHPSTIMTSQYVLVDYNRSGNPLCEIVTEPELTSPEEAREFMNNLITIIEYLNIFESNGGIIKADANISIKESGYVRSEVKNITGFKEIERALFYEVQRHKRAFKDKENFVIDTRTWDADTGVSHRLRTKESEDDYGYIIDTDLVIIDITKEMIETTRKNMPELADEKMQKFMQEHNIAADTAEILSKDKDLALMYEEVAKAVTPELASKWVRRELSRVLNYNKKKLGEVKLTPKHFIDLLILIEKGSITEKVGQKILNEIVISPFDVNEYVKREGLEQVSDTNEIEIICLEAIKENPAVVEQIKAGEEKAVNFLIGQVMRKSRGKAKPDVVTELIKKILN
jgi:aspartyl-tRNA(Asn)/glutamyl-tRNA(Gln) amidotransferase subunit B